MSIIEGERPPDSYLFGLKYLLLVNLLTCGVELCTSAAFGYLPPLLLEAGLSESSMSVIMAAGPLLALFVLPAVGHASDQCKSAFGRRRPFLFYLSILTLISMLILPGKVTLESIFIQILPKKYAELALLSIGVVIFDCCTQVSFTPLECLLSDSCQTEEHHNRSFVVFTFMTSLGACLGYWLLSVDWGSTLLGEYLGGHRNTFFALLALIFVTTSSITLYVAYDPPLRTLARTLPLESSSQVPLLKQNGHLIQDRTTNKYLINHKVPFTTKSPTIPAPLPTRKRSPFVNLCTLITSPVWPIAYLCSFKWLLPRLSETYNGFRTMPSALKKLWMANLVTCIAVMGFRLFFTDYVGEWLYHGNPDSPEGSDERKLYETGIRTGSWGLFLHSIIAVISSVFLEKFMLSFGAKMTYLFGMGLFAIVTGLMLVVDSVQLTLILAAFSGCATASITTVPYTLLSIYHSEPEFFFQDLDATNFHLHGKGADFALLDSSYILSEVISSFVFGMVVEFTDMTLSYILCSFFFSILGCIFILHVQYTERLSVVK